MERKEKGRRQGKEFVLKLWTQATGMCSGMGGRVVTRRAAES
jgi:hypothetical protein